MTTELTGIEQSLETLKLRIASKAAGVDHVPWQRWSDIVRFNSKKQNAAEEFLEMLKHRKFSNSKELAYAQNAYSVEKDAMSKRRFPVTARDQQAAAANQWDDLHGVRKNRLAKFRNFPTTFGRKFVSPIVKRAFDGEDFMMPLNGAEYRALKALWLMRDFLENDSAYKPFASSWKDFRRSLNGSRIEDRIYIAYCRGFVWVNPDGTMGHRESGEDGDPDAV